MLGALIHSVFLADATSGPRYLFLTSSLLSGAPIYFTLHDKGAGGADRLYQHLSTMAAMDLDGAGSKCLFAQVQFYMVQTENLQGDSAREVRIPTNVLKG